MANVKVMSRPTVLRVFYDVDDAVGRGCPNRRDDVYLVQFLINVLWDKKDTHGLLVGAAGKPAPRVDGICGAETIAAIRKFQEYYGASVVDGRVDPVPPGQQQGPIHHKFYTMIGLNANVGLLLSSDRHTLICNEPNFPLLLKKKLFWGS
jgi:peptidoglycan hydrolase-like protein with peptidoglycan-binding domain